MKNAVCYKLVAVIMHHAWGGNTGHYTTYFLDHAQQQWFYDFNLITVLVIDRFGEGIPVAWAIANREDVTILVEFLKAIRESTGPLQTCWFMSDDANQYFNAWKGVFHDKETKKLLCAWHVGRAWRTWSIGSVVNTNMFLESFHRTLKVVYLEHKHNRRIDYLLHTLLKIARDKVFEQLMKLEKGKFTHRVSEINKRHKEWSH